ncbi:hypothetical protein GCM10028807_36200 [Spirosoma daeguense]
MLTFVTALLSCERYKDTSVSPNNDLGVSIQNGRLAFKDKASFEKVLSQIRTISTEEEAAKWESKFNYASLRKYNAAHRDKPKLEEMNLPIFNKVLLNENAEYIIGKTIVWFNDGYVHYIDNQDENLLQQIKSNPALSKNKSAVITKVIPVSEDVKSTMGTIGGTSLYAWYQKMWSLNCSNGLERKTVYELVSTTIQGGQGNTFDYTLYIRIKLEWRGSSGWRPNAGETRQVYVNISGSVWAQCNVITPPPFSFNTWYTSNSDIHLNLTGTSGARALQNNGSTCDGLIHYSVNGEIYSEVHMNGTCSSTLQLTSPYHISGTLW